MMYIKENPLYCMQDKMENKVFMRFFHTFMISDMIIERIALLINPL